ncbi:MAG TPA: hypothetical protein VK426_03640 [Methanobacterium sp.]|nr:hypothetical protein [Methanobacterium sp.]
MANLQRLNGPQIGSFLDKEVIKFKTMKEGEIKLSFVEIRNSKPHRVLRYHLKIED